MPVYCTSCRAQRVPADDGPCPVCGAPAYPHKTNHDEFVAQQEAARQVDRIAHALERTDRAGPPAGDR